MSNLKIQDTLEILGNGTAEGSELVKLSDFSDGVSGYCKLPNGTEMCWDTMAVGESSVSFPHPFSGDKIVVLIGYLNCNSLTSVTTYVSNASTGSITQEGFTCYSSGRTRQYIAIGN